MKHKIPPLVLLLLALNILCVVTFFIRHWMISDSSRRQAIINAEVAANSLKRMNSLNAGDYQQLSSMCRKWETTGYLTDQELRWCLQLLADDSRLGNNDGMALSQVLITTRMEYSIQSFSLNQKSILHEYIVKTLQGEPGAKGNKHIIALNFANRIHDVKCIPYVTPLLESPIIRVREMSAKTIVFLNQK